MERFVSQATEGHDANACVASFLLARESPAGVAARWVRDVVNGLERLPRRRARRPSGPSRPRTAGPRRRRPTPRSAYAVAMAESQSRFTGVQSESGEELERKARVQAKPVAKLGEPLGLALDRRGLDPV